ncbi:MAG: hypothetical protein ABWY50_02840 [Aeromicrobium sp.]
MMPSKPESRSWARAGLAAVALMLLTVTGGCGKDEEKEPADACGLIDPELVSDLADGRDWKDVGSLYSDGRFGDGCTVLVSGEQLLLVTLVDFGEAGNVDTAKQEVLKERDAYARTCPDTTQPPVTDDSVTSVCLSERKLDYNEWNPRRLVRVTIEQTPGVSLSEDDGARVSDDINERADELSG